MKLKRILSTLLAFTLAFSMPLLSIATPSENSGNDPNINGYQSIKLDPYHTGTNVLTSSNPDFTLTVNISQDSYYVDSWSLNEDANIKIYYVYVKASNAGETYDYLPDGALFDATDLYSVARTSGNGDGYHQISHVTFYYKVNPVSTTTPVVTPTPEETTTPVVTPTPEETTTPVVTPTPEETTTPVVTPTPEETTTPVVTPTPEETTTPVVTPTPEGTTTPAVTPTPEETTTPVVTPTPEETTTPVVTPTPEESTTPYRPSYPNPVPTPIYTPVPTPTIDVDDEEIPGGEIITPTPTPTPTPTSTPTPIPTLTSTPVPISTPTVTPTPTGTEIEEDIIPGGPIMTPTPAPNPASTPTSTPIPQQPLPNTGGLPIALLYGLGGISILAGGLLRKRNRK